MSESVIANRGLLRYIDLIVDRIILFTDYFIVRQHVTLSETTLFFLGLSRGLWYAVFGHSAAYGAPLLSSSSIAIAFCIIPIAHIVSFFLPSPKYRIGVVFAYGFMWCLMGLLYAWTVFPSVAVPTFFVLTLLSVFIGIRLIKDLDQTKPNGFHD